jgi:ABC-type glycerol-3-phosphate transport system permease component
MVGQFTTSWGLLLTASVMSTIPAVILYFVVQKSLIGGILAGSVKG